MQHFLSAKLERLEEYTDNNFPQDLSEGKVMHLHLYLDNAGSYFKSVGAIKFFTLFIKERGGATKCIYVDLFGAQGCGKGFFDGLNGALKNKVHNLTKRPKTGGDSITGTATGYISNVQDINDALK